MKRVSAVKSFEVASRRYVDRAKESTDGSLADAAVRVFELSWLLGSWSAWAPSLGQGARRRLCWPAASAPVWGAGHGWLECNFGTSAPLLPRSRRDRNTPPTAPCKESGRPAGRCAAERRACRARTHGLSSKVSRSFVDCLSCTRAGGRGRSRFGGALHRTHLGEARAEGGRIRRPRCCRKSSTVARAHWSGLLRFSRSQAHRKASIHLHGGPPTRRRAGPHLCERQLELLDDSAPGRAPEYLHAPPVAAMGFGKPCYECEVAID